MYLLRVLIYSWAVPVAGALVYFVCWGLILKKKSREVRSQCISQPRSDNVYTHTQDVRYYNCYPFLDVKVEVLSFFIYKFIWQSFNIKLSRWELILLKDHTYLIHQVAIPIFWMISLCHSPGHSHLKFYLQFSLAFTFLIYLFQNFPSFYSISSLTEKPLIYT